VNHLYGSDANLLSPPSSGLHCHSLGKYSRPVTLRCSLIQIFSIFGASNPGLNAVPIIFILTVTAIKDAIEDWRRTVLDAELNNSPVYRLVGWTNVNISTDDISLWRKIKKASTRTVISTYRKVKGLRKSKQGSEKDVEGNIDHRPSIAPTVRDSFYTERTSFHSTREQQGDEIAMTPVPSPQIRPTSPGNGQLAPPGEPPNSALTFETATEASKRASGASSSVQDKRASKRKSLLPPSKDFGNVINPYRHATEEARFKKDYWKNVQVGDFVRIYNDEPIPADLVVLSTSDPDGACYVETKNLDGETNLKVRQALQATRKVRHARDCEKSEFWIESEGPSPNLYGYNAVLRFHQRDPKDPDAPSRLIGEPIGINNMLLRGCSIKNTEWALGIVIFTGQESKIMLNSGITPSKRAQLAKNLNWNVIYNL
jgi:phospholipid-translocating ATPase